jgi:hypothetical protein
MGTCENVPHRPFAICWMQHDSLPECTYAHGHVFHSTACVWHSHFLLLSFFVCYTGRSVLPSEKQMTEFRAASIEQLVTDAMRTSFGVSGYYAQTNRALPTEPRRGSLLLTISDARAVQRGLKRGQRLQLPKTDGTFQSSFVAINAEDVGSVHDAPLPPAEVDPQHVRVHLEGLPPAGMTDFQFVNESVLAKAIHLTFNVRTDSSGRTCAIYTTTDERGRRSGHIDVNPEARDGIASKLADGVTLDLICGPKENPKVFHNTRDRACACCWA